MKLVQLNLWQGRVLWQITRFLEQEQPDIVCLQEVYSSREQVPHWDSFSSLEAIQGVLPELRYWFFAPLYSFLVNGRRVYGGNAIGSRYPLSDQQTVFVHGEYTEDTDPAPNTRNLQTCKLKLDDNRSLSLLNHHAYWERTPLGSPETVKMMRRVAEVTTTLPRPLIVSGDMNVLPESDTMRVFEGKLENLTGTKGIETTLSVLARAFDRKNIVACDHVLVSDDIQVRSYGPSETIVSDHKPIILEFDI